ncbi:MAG TPA: hypothetical protein VI565_08065, partial [Burkholderiales bacterium]|nr:hypothetical protein [Burkholderiales bacterium]
EKTVRTFYEDDFVGFLSIFFLFLGTLFLLAQLPAVFDHQAQLSGWHYLFPAASFLTAIKSKRDGVAWAAVIYFSLLFLVDVFYGIGGI